jgi:hypothetical protein
LQAIEEISHFQTIPEMPRQYAIEEIPEWPRQLQNFLIYGIYLTYFQFWKKSKPQEIVNSKLI